MTSLNRWDTEETKINKEEEDGASNESFTTSKFPTSSKKRSITFAPTLEVRSIRHVDDFTHEEKKIIWYNGIELSLIKAECAETIHRMVLHQQGITRFDTTTHCSRGLEYRTPIGARHRNRNKHNASDSVLSEQDAQWDQDINDEDAIAIVYKMYSAPCQEAAHEQGLRDQEIFHELQRELNSESIYLCDSSPSSSSSSSSSPLTPRRTPDNNQSENSPGNDPNVIIKNIQNSPTSPLCESKKRKVMCPAA